MDAALVAALAYVEASPDHRVLRRIIPPMAQISDARLVNARSAMFVDCETTGLDHATAEVIEISMVAFWFDDDGIAQVMQALHAYSEPKAPITPEITKLTGITNEMVAGWRLDPALVDEVATRVGADCEVIIAHNAEFDRPFFEALGPSFAKRPWACSMSQVPWDEHGINGRRLEYIASSLGFFYDAHNATSDCYAGIHVLGQKLGDGRTALAHLLDRCFLDTKRVWAIGSMLIRLSPMTANHCAGWYFWKFVHNALIHPLLALPWEPRWAQRAHDWTAQRCIGGG